MILIVNKKYKNFKKYKKYKKYKKLILAYNIKEWLNPNLKIHTQS
jgi:hypothetical protein